MEAVLETYTRRTGVYQTVTLPARSINSLHAHSETLAVIAVLNHVKMLKELEGFQANK